MKKSIILAGLMVVFLFSGCAKRLEHINTNKVIKSEHVVIKNYKVGEVNTAYVGNPMIEVFDYNITLKSTDKMKPTEDFIFNSDSSNKYIFTKNDEFKILGKWNIDKVKYTVVNNKKMGDLGLLIRKDGSIHNKIVNMIPYGIDAVKYITIVYNYKYEPKTVRLKTVTITTKETRKGKINYQLIYTGSDDSSFFITYREFTKSDLARPSFFQNLTYSRKSSQIRFRNLVLNIISVDNEKIMFAVKSDDYN